MFRLGVLKVISFLRMAESGGGRTGMALGNLWIMVREGRNDVGEWSLVFLCSMMIIELYN